MLDMISVTKMLADDGDDNALVGATPSLSLTCHAQPNPLQTHKHTKKPNL